MSKDLDLSKLNTEPDTRTDAERFEDGIKHLFAVPKKDVLDSLESDKQERKKKRESVKK